MFKLKKIKICFKTSDYETQSCVDTVFIILDKSRGYYGIKFSTDNSDIKYGNVTCINSGNEYDSHYFERTFYRWGFYHKHPNWDAKACNFYKFLVKVPLDIHVQEK